MNAPAPLSSLSLAIADRLAAAGDDGVSLRDLEVEFHTRYAGDKVRSLCRNGWVIAEDQGMLVLVHDPRKVVFAIWSPCGRLLIGSGTDTYDSHMGT